LLVGTLAAASAVYLATRGPNLQAFNDTLREVVALTGGIQSSTDELAATPDLKPFAAMLAVRLDDLDPVEVEARATNPVRHRDALTTAIERQQLYIRELQRLAGLSPSAATTDQFVAVRDLAASAEASLAAALALGPEELRTNLDLSAAALLRVLATSHRTWLDRKAARASALRINRRRAATLSALQSFTNDFDGIISRYSAARTELSDWIARVNSVGVTYDEAYQMLYQQTERRRELRGELAALRAPAPFAQDKQAVLAAMDRAIDATEAAARGISEYQFDYSYARYDETPGWQQFESASDEISDAYGQALATYAERKRTLFARLSKRVRVPTLTE
jgi:hypothetical protein